MNKSSIRFSKNFLYTLIQMSFWMIYCSCYGFASYYLVEKGFGASVVGIITAIAGIISAFGQPFVGSIADKATVGYKKPLITVLITQSLFGLIMLFVSALDYAPGICLSYGLIMLLLGIATPLVNTAGVVFADEINFGMARGLGSFGYALASYVLGYLTASLGCNVIPIFITVASIAMMFLSISLPNAAAGETKESAVTDIQNLDKKDIQNSSRGFLSKYPAFTFLWIVLIFMLTVHSTSNTYLLQILEKGGGDSHNLGIAVAIAAIMEIPMIFCFERINKYISTQSLLVIAAATYLIKSLLQLINTNLTVFYLIQILQFTSWGVYASASVYFAKEHIPGKDQTKAQSYMSNALTIGTVIGTFIGGQLIDLRGVNSMLVFQTMMGAISLIGIIIWKLKFYSKNKSA